VAPKPGRPDLYVVARILEVLWKEGRPMRKTRLQMAAGINYSVFQRYIEVLGARGLVRSVVEPDGGEAVELSAKGQEALQFLLQAMSRVLEGTSSHDLV
jgi:predicted transcriptional regulator